MLKSHFYLACLIFIMFALPACDSIDSEKPHKDTVNAKVSAPLEQEYSAVLNPKWSSGIFHSESETFFLVGEQGAITYSKDGTAWLAASTPITTELRTILGGNKALLVAAGVNGKVLRSQNNGKSWDVANIDVPQGIELDQISFGTITYVESSNVWLVAGTHNAIIRSTDNGENWEFVSYDGSTKQLEILDLYADSVSGKLFFAAQRGVSGVSRDGGLNWEISNQAVDKIKGYTPHLVKFFRIGKLLFIAGDEGNVLRSMDNGDTWEVTKLPSSGYVTNIALDSNKNSLALTTQTGEIFFSKDNGENWRSVNFEVQNWPSNEIPYISKLYYDKQTSSFVLVGNSGLIARSRDGGVSWYADIFADLKNLSVTTLIRNDKTGVYVAAGLGGVIAVSHQLGLSALPTENWQIVRPGIDLYIRDAVHIPRSNQFLAVGQLGGVWLSEDDANSWRLIEVDYPVKSQPPHLRDIVIDDNTGALIAAGPAASIIRSEDSGKTWSSVFRGEFSKGEAFTQVLHDKKNNHYFIAEVIYGNIYRSADVGKTWEPIAQVQKNGHRLWHGAISEPLGLMLLAGQNGGVAVGKNNGEDWLHPETKVSNDLYGAYADQNSPLLIAVGDYGKILRSEDGEHWSSVESGTTQRLRRVVSDDKNGVLVAVGAGGTVLRSENKGLDWQATELPNYEGELRTGFFDKANNMFLVGQDGGLFKSSDRAKSWKRVPTPTERHLRSAALNPETGTIVAVGDALLRIKATQ